jgi:hypothetical protein
MQNVPARSVQHLSSVLVLTLSLAGCTFPLKPLSEPTTPNTTPPLTAVLAEARANAVVCESPAPALRVPKSSFRYGCFCGAGWPALDLKSTPIAGESSTDRRERLIAKYYSIKPIDDIDAACQAHDVCWTFHDGPRAECNEQFGKTMNYMFELFSRAPSTLTTSLSDRCRWLAADLGTAKDFFMESKDELGKGDPSLGLGRFLAFPSLLLILPSMAWGTVVDIYPAPNDRCMLPRPPN